VSRPRRGCVLLVEAVRAAPGTSESPARSQMRLMQVPPASHNVHTRAWLHRSTCPDLLNHAGTMCLDSFCGYTTCTLHITPPSEQLVPHRFSRLFDKSPGQGSLSWMSHPCHLMATITSHQAAPATDDQDQVAKKAKSDDPVYRVSPSAAMATAARTVPPPFAALLFAFVLNRAVREKAAPRKTSRSGRCSAAFF
jgi:hypothetical protein